MKVKEKKNTAKVNETPPIMTLIRPQIELPGSGRPQIDFVRDVATALAPLRETFIQGDQVVEIREPHGGDTAGTVHLHPLSPKEAVTAFERHIEFFLEREDEDGVLERVPMSMTRPDLLLASFPMREILPRINRILNVSIPILHEGKIVYATPGFDERFETFLDPSAPVPDKMNLPEALALIEDLLGNDDGLGFAWRDDESKTAAISRFLTPFCRGLMQWERAPLFIIIANQPRVGKDTLANLVSLIFVGVEATSAPLKKDSEAEMRKRITSALRAGEPLIHLPNLKGHIDFASLEAATDGSHIWRDRQLGGNRQLTLPNEAEFSISANIGATWTPDLDGRAVIIAMNYPGDDINRRVFRHPDIFDFARRNRRRILSAFAALVENWDASGRPSGPTPHASFPAWARIVGGIMHAANLGDPCIRPAGLNDLIGDPETEDMRALFQLAHKTHGEAPIKKDALYALIEKFEDPIFPGLELGSRAGQTRLGIKLKAFQGRDLSGITLHIDKSDRFRLRYIFSAHGSRQAAQTLQTLQTSQGR